MSVYALNPPPTTAELNEALISLHATLVAIGSSWETVGARQRFELLQQAHALEPLARVKWQLPKYSAKRPAPDWLITNRDAWLAVAGRADLAIRMDRNTEEVSPRLVDA